MVCNLGIDLQSPADMFHFLCSLCASLILRVCCAIAKATWVDEWWCPLVNIAPYMCHRPKEPMSWTSLLSSFALLLSPHLFSTFFPTLPLTFYHIVPRPHSIFFFLCLPLLPSPSILLMVVFHSYSSAVEGGMRPFLFLLCALIFARPSDQRMGWECQALGWE